MVTHIVFWALKDEAEGHSKRENAEASLWLSREMKKKGDK